MSRQWPVNKFTLLFVFFVDKLLNICYFFAIIVLVVDNYINIHITFSTFIVIHRLWINLCITCWLGVNLLLFLANSFFRARFLLLHVVDSLFFFYILSILLTIITGLCIRQIIYVNIYYVVVFFLFLLITLLIISGLFTICIFCLDLFPGFNNHDFSNAYLVSKLLYQTTVCSLSFINLGGSIWIKNCLISGTKH
jgi:hypothetical protein